MACYLDYVYIWVLTGFIAVDFSISMFGEFMIVACICGGSIEAFLFVLGLTSLMKGVNWVRRKLHTPKHCGRCKEHDKKEDTHV